MIVRIASDNRYEWEPPLRGELAEFTGKGNTYRLLGDSEYIRNNTDGFVILAPGEYDIVSE